jgi:hypothetical protein
MGELREALGQPKGGHGQLYARPDVVSDEEWDGYSPTGRVPASQVFERSYGAGRTRTFDRRIMSRAGNRLWSRIWPGRARYVRGVG